MPMPNLLGMEWPALTEIFLQMEQPQYRARQLMQWIYEQGKNDFDQMSNLPQGLRTRLAEKYVVGKGRIAERQQAADGSIKLAIAYGPNEIAECVILPYRHGNSLCLSSQVGCKLACAFCATGQQGFTADLSMAEIIEQIWWANRELAAKGERISHLVYMGMGEPLLNYENVVESLRFANNPAVYNIGMRNITISTAGIVPGILRLAEEGLPLTLAISLHAPVNYLRDQIMPINRRYALDELMQAVRTYAKKTRRRVTFEYVLLQGFNDQPVHAQELAALLRGIIANVNLIPYNEVSNLPWRSPDNEQIKAFLASLKKAGINATLRRELGPEIDAACGQLRGKLRGEG